MARSKLVALIGLLVVGVILIVQMAQGETNALHWIGLVAIAVALIATVVDIRKSSRALG